MDRITMKGVAECCEMFRANLVPREDTKRRQATIYINGFIDYMHRRGCKIVRPYENQNQG